MRRKLRTIRGRQPYALPMEMAEPVFGQIKQSRGFRQFLLRGLKKVNREWLLICAGHNLLKLFRFETCLPGRGSTNGPAGAAGKQRRAVNIPMIRKLAQRGHSASSGPVAVSRRSPNVEAGQAIPGRAAGLCYWQDKQAQRR